MGTGIKHYLTSYKTSIVLLLVYATLLAVATVIEKYSGTSAARTIVYYSPILFLVYGLMVANFLAVTVRRKLLRAGKPGFILVHFAFLVILAGALVTHLFGKEGTLHVREGQTVNNIMVAPSYGHTYIQTLPFEVELIRFTLERYPGSNSPSDYESHLRIHQDGQTREALISMNNVLDIEGYRLFQASYDKDERGSILSVNQDVAGRNITYTGYVLLLIGFVLCFTGRNTRFRQLYRQLKQTGSRPMVWAFCLLSLSVSVSAEAQQQDTGLLRTIMEKPIDRRHAAEFGSLPMQSVSGRIQPINTFASEVLRKLHKSSKMGRLNADQFLLSLITLPDMWMQVPLIAYDNKQIAFNHDLNEGYCSYNSMFDSNGRYKLQDDLEAAFAKQPSQRTGFDKDLIKLDEQVNILHQLLNLQMLSIFPAGSNESSRLYAPGENLSGLDPHEVNIILQLTTTYRMSVVQGIQSGDWQQADAALREIRIYQQANSPLNTIDYNKIKAELWYNKADVFGMCKKQYFILGGVLLLVSLTLLFGNNRRPLVWVQKLITVCIFVALCFHLVGIGVRWYIAGYAPWSNSYETMVLLSALCVMGGMLFARRDTLPLALSTLFGGVVLFVSGLNWMNPQITPLIPVLKSPWLMIHVALVMIAYGFFGISFLLGLTNLILVRMKNSAERLSVRIKELTIMNEMSLLAGLAFMSAGVFVGAVWANESWGRYWGWDPKETWALITIVIYAVVTHLRLIRKGDNTFLFNLLSVLAFACVLMTYFGVNYLLSGMHSYN